MIRSLSRNPIPKFWLEVKIPLSSPCTEILALHKLWSFIQYTQIRNKMTWRHLYQTNYYTYPLKTALCDLRKLAFEIKLENWILVVLASLITLSSSHGLLGLWIQPELDLAVLLAKLGFFVCFWCFRFQASNAGRAHCVFPDRSVVSSLGGCGRPSQSGQEKPFPCRRLRVTEAGRQ